MVYVPQYSAYYPQMMSTAAAAEPIYSVHTAAPAFTQESRRATVVDAPDEIYAADDGTAEPAPSVTSDQPESPGEPQVPPPTASVSGKS